MDFFSIYIYTRSANFTLVPEVVPTSKDLFWKCLQTTWLNPFILYNKGTQTFSNRLTNQNCYFTIPNIKEEVIMLTFGVPFDLI